MADGLDIGEVLDDSALAVYKGLDDKPEGRAVVGHRGALLATALLAAVLEPGIGAVVDGDPLAEAAGEALFVLHLE